MNFVLVHGWGFGPGVFDALAPLLPGDVARVDLGFLKTPADASSLAAGDDWPRDAIAIGHSLGVLWLLHERPESFRALVSLQGFDCFACHIERARLLAMRKGLRRDPYGLMRMFWKSCGSEPVAPDSDLNVERLEEGLNWLMEWDSGERRKTLEVPVLALASHDDQIVPETMSEKIWGDALQWSKAAGHLLPQRHPQVCADRISSFADDLTS